MGLLRSKNFFISTWTVTNGIPTPDFDQIEFDVQQGNKVGPAIILGILERIGTPPPGHRIIRFWHCISYRVYHGPGVFHWNLGGISDLCQQA